MFEDFDSVSHKAHIPEPELVPILDALTSVIFFLLLSTTFIELTKITVPPSQTSVVTDPQSPPPPAPKLYIKVDGEKNLEMKLKWAGKNPDQIKKTVPRALENARSREVEDMAHAIVKEFKVHFPEEKSIQMIFSGTATYQELISVMDGVRVEIQDIVLLSPEDMKVGE